MGWLVASNQYAFKTPPGGFFILTHFSAFCKHLARLRHIFFKPLANRRHIVYSSRRKKHKILLFRQFHIAIRCTVTEACRRAGFGARERENHSTGAVRTRPFRSSESCLGESQSLRKLFREKAGNGRGDRDSVSRVQVRRTAVSAAFCGEKDECVRRALLSHSRDPCAVFSVPPFQRESSAVLCLYKTGGFFSPETSAPPVSAPTYNRSLR